MLLCVLGMPRELRSNHLKSNVKMFGIACFSIWGMVVSPEPHVCEYDMVAYLKRHNRAAEACELGRHDSQARRGVLGPLILFPAELFQPSYSGLPREEIRA